MVLVKALVVWWCGMRDLWYPSLLSQAGQSLVSRILNADLMIGNLSKVLAYLGSPIIRTLARVKMFQAFRISPLNQRLFEKTIGRDYSKRLFEDYSKTIRRLFKDYSKTIWRLFEDYSKTIRRLFEDYSKAIRRLFKDYSKTIHRLFKDYCKTIVRLFKDYLNRHVTKQSRIIQFVG